MASGDTLALRTNWEIYADTPQRNDRTSRVRPRSLLKPQILLDHERSRAGQARTHPEERSKRTWLLSDPSGAVPLLQRPRGGCKWGACGPALRVCRGAASEAAFPYLINDNWDCLQLSGAYPQCTGIGARSLPAGLISRLTYEVKCDGAASTGGMVQVGIARVGAPHVEEVPSKEDDDFLAAHNCHRLGEASYPLLGSVLFTSMGDIMANGSFIEVLSAGAGHKLQQRDDDWWSGAPTWFASNTETVNVLLEVDLARGCVSFRLNAWSEEPLVISVDGLVDDDGSQRPWSPMVSLLAVGQEARILDLHVVTDG